MTLRLADIQDCEMYYHWANDPTVRENSYQSDLISYETHQEWYRQKVQDPNVTMLVLEKLNEPIGQVRFDYDPVSAFATISISIAHEYRNKGLASKTIHLAMDYYKRLYPDILIRAYIKKSNLASVHAFLKAGFIPQEDITYLNQPSKLLLYQHKIY